MNLNYIAMITLSIFRVLDIIFTTIIVGILGGIELNPLGFNPLSISLITLWTIFMWIIARYIGDNEPWDGIYFIVIMIFVGQGLAVNGWHIMNLTQYYF